MERLVQGNADNDESTAMCYIV